MTTAADVAYSSPYHFPLSRRSPRPARGVDIDWLLPLLLLRRLSPATTVDDNTLNDGDVERPSPMLTAKLPPLGDRTPEPSPSRSILAHGPDLVSGPAPALRSPETEDSRDISPVPKNSPMPSPVVTTVAGIPTSGVNATAVVDRRLRLTPSSVGDGGWFFCRPAPSPSSSTSSCSCYCCSRRCWCWCYWCWCWGCACCCCLRRFLMFRVARTRRRVQGVCGKR